MTIEFIFDLDGAITDATKFRYQAWKALVDLPGTPIDETFNGAPKGISQMDFLDRILAHGHRESMFIPAEKEALVQQENNHYIQSLEHLTTGDVLPDVVPLLQQVQARHIPCVVASASKNAPLILEKLDVYVYFTTIVGSDLLSKGKSDPEIFLAAADSIDMSPQNATGSEDAQLGIDGLRAAGIYVVDLPASQPLIGADMQVSRMTEPSVDVLLNR